MYFHTSSEFSRRVTSEQNLGGMIKTYVKGSRSTPGGFRYGFKMNGVEHMAHPVTISFTP